MTITLRPDQSKLQAECFEDWQSGARNVMPVLATGGGKTVIFSDTARIFDDNRDDVLMMAHRQELVGQMSLHLGRQGVRHKILAPRDIVKAISADHRREFDGNSYIDPSARASVGGVDTILSKSGELADMLKRKRFVVCDEGHHCLRLNKWGKVFDLLPNALGMLPTASPSRADGKGLGAHADGIAHTMRLGPGMRWLIDHGALCEYEIVCPATDFDRSALKVGDSGDITPASMKAESERSHIVGDVVEQYCNHAYGKRAVVFVTDVGTADKVAEKFNSWGIAAASISAKTADMVRSEQIRRLRDGRLKVLVNVDLLGEGFDLPAIEVVVMARPTQSLAVYLQQFGRALRVLAGKSFGLVIDLVHNVEAHSLPDIPRRWTLDRRENRGRSRPSDPELVPIKICTVCTKPYEAIYHACPHCGAVPVVAANGGRGPLEVIMGDLTRLDKETLDRMRKAAELASPERKASQAKFASGGMASAQRVMEAQAGLIDGQHQLADAISLWAGLQRHKGRSDAEIYMRFYHAAGSDMVSVLADTDGYERLTQEVIKWVSA